MTVSRNDMPEASADTKGRRPRRPGIPIRGRRQLAVGDTFPVEVLDRLEALSGDAARAPDPGRLVHVQMRRYAGCPVCNLHHYPGAAPVRGPSLHRSRRPAQGPLPCPGRGILSPRRAQPPFLAARARRYGAAGAHGRPLPPRCPDGTRGRPARPAGGLPPRPPRPGRGRQVRPARRRPVVSRPAARTRRHHPRQLPG